MGSIRRGWQVLLALGLAASLEAQVEDPIVGGGGPPVGGGATGSIDPGVQEPDRSIGASRLLQVDVMDPHRNPSVTDPGSRGPLDSSGAPGEGSAVAIYLAHYGDLTDASPEERAMRDQLLRLAAEYDRIQQEIAGAEQERDRQQAKIDQLEKEEEEARDQAEAAESEAADSADAAARLAALQKQVADARAALEEYKRQFDQAVALAEKARRRDGEQAARDFRDTINDLTREVNRRQKDLDRAQQQLQTQQKPLQSTIDRNAARSKQAKSGARDQDRNRQLREAREAAEKAQQRIRELNRQKGAVQQQGRSVQRGLDAVRQDAEQARRRQASAAEEAARRARLAQLQELQNADEQAIRTRIQNVSRDLENILEHSRAIREQAGEEAAQKWLESLGTSFEWRHADIDSSIPASFSYEQDVYGASVIIRH